MAKWIPDLDMMYPHLEREPWPSVRVPYLGKFSRGSLCVNPSELFAILPSDIPSAEFEDHALEIRENGAE